MNKETFLKRLNDALRGLPPRERARTVQYYRESIEDRMEEGLSEAAAVAELGTVEDIAESLAAGGALPAPRQRGGWTKALVILGSPLWLVWLIVLCAVIFTIYVVAWAVIVVLFAVILAFGVALLAGVVALVLYLLSRPATGIFLLGAGMVCGGLGLALFFPALTLTRWLIRGTAAAAKRLWRSVFPWKEDAK